MKSRNGSYIRPVDIHAAMARAHADRAEYIRQALIKLPGLVKRAVSHLRPNRHRLPHNGAWA